MVRGVREACLSQQWTQILMRTEKVYLVNKKISKYCQKYFCSFLRFCFCFCCHRNVQQMYFLKLLTRMPIYHFPALESQAQVGFCRLLALESPWVPPAWAPVPRPRGSVYFKRARVAVELVAWGPGCWLADRRAALCSEAAHIYNALLLQTRKAWQVLLPLLTLPPALSPLFPALKGSWD